MNTSAKVSVIIPTYNRPHLIGRAIQSVLNQTYNNFEIVVIDSSPDNKTGEAVKSIKDDRIKYVHNSKKTILAIGKNQGIKASSQDSRYVAFLDDDDEWLPKFLEKTVAVLEGKKDAVMATCFWELRTRDGKRIRDDKFSNNFWEISLGSGCLVRKKLFTEENIWYDENLEFMEDADFGRRVLMDHKWEVVPEVLRIYYILPLQGEVTMSGNMSAKAVNLFYDKNYPAYKKINRKALAYFHFTMGKIFMRTEDHKKGRFELLKGFLLWPRPIYVAHYLISLADIIFPDIFKNVRLRKWKAKFMKGV